ncbi:MAG TPA: imidazole glycerol phosphate synthase subunit HisH [Cellvibrionaceae bacterium]|nr:imidazole glycerol phosphate synthase subunit HisH [Cellvibrionaceae bacterium]HMW72778.1 imidazole glycerol phosphate synthase subunit HisH [Cellvibrionaceae bacterium]HNG58282.1 imidazole glycerol phosphate synthase subunit HisH [Cellvibrionaceae bacterium]
MAQVAIIDYGMGNLHSVASALHLVSPASEIVITADPAVIANAERIIFPGVGAMRDCMGEIKRLHLDACLQQALDAGKPTLAICVGMQALLASSEENGGVPCLNMLPGAVYGFNQDSRFKQINDTLQGPQRLKVPHMGWNQVVHTQSHPLWQGIADNSRFYFVHSYFVQTSDESLVAGRATHGIPVVAALARRNLFAVQFHPEKSHQAGLTLLNNFMHWQP